MARGEPGNHSARRLLRVIQRLNDAAVAEEAQELSLIEVIAVVRGMDVGNPALLAGAAGILELPRQVLSDIAELDDAQVRYAEPGVRAVVEALSPTNLGQPWSALYPKVESVGLPALAICALLLDAEGGERELDEAQLLRVAEDAEALLAEVRRTPSIPADVVKFVESALLSLLRAVDEYWIKGAGAVESAIDVTVGRAVRERQFEKTDKEARPVIRKLGLIMTQAALVVAVANDVHEFPATINDVVQGIIHMVTDEPAEPTLPDVRELPPGDEEK